MEKTVNIAAVTIIMVYLFALLLIVATLAFGLIQKEDAGEVFDLVNKNFLFIVTGAAGYLFGPAIRKKE